MFTVKHFRLSIQIFMAIILVALFSSRWTHLLLSLSTIVVLRDKLIYDYTSETPSPFSNPLPSESIACRMAMYLIDSVAWPYSHDESFRRLTRYVSLSCESGDSIVKRFDREMAAGLTPLTIDAIYVADILARSGHSEKAMALRRSIPDVSLWYINLGRIEIERMRNEPKGLAYFQLAEQIDPSFNTRKSPLYMHLCLISIRDKETYLVKEPCMDFDRVQRTSLSRLLLGRSYFSRKEFDRAIAYLAEAISLDQSSGDAYYWLGRSLLATGNVSAAENAYRSGIVHAPQYPWNYLELAELEARQGCCAKAREYLDRMRATNIEEAIAAADIALQGMCQ